MRESLASISRGVAAIMITVVAPCLAFVAVESRTVSSALVWSGTAIVLWQFNLAIIRITPSRRLVGTIIRMNPTVWEHLVGAAAILGALVATNRLIQSTSAATIRTGAGLGVLVLWAVIGYAMLRSADASVVVGKSGQVAVRNLVRTRVVAADDIDEVWSPWDRGGRRVSLSRMASECGSTPSLLPVPYNSASMCQWPERAEALRVLGPIRYTRDTNVTTAPTVRVGRMRALVVISVLAVLMLTGAVVWGYLSARGAS